MFNLYSNANSETESKGRLVCDMTSSDVPAFAGAIKTIERDSAVAGVWVNHHGKEWYVEKAA